MIWLRCWTRATSVSKNHEPFTGINLRVPEMTRHWAPGPPPHNGPCFQLPFPHRDTRGSSSHPTGPHHLGTPAPLFPWGLSPASFPHRSSTYSQSFPVWGGQALISPYFTAFQVYFFPLLKVSDHFQESKHQWWNWEHFPLIRLSALNWSHITSTGEGSGASAVLPCSPWETSPSLSWSMEVTEKQSPG